MMERRIDEAMLSALIETGEIKRTEGEHLFIFKYFPSRRDNLVCAAAVEEESLVIKTVLVLEPARSAMKIGYNEADDILYIRFSDEPVVRDESLNWNVHVGYSESGIREITILEAKKRGYLPIKIDDALKSAA
jgi:uncharacterized protein YuzE